MIRSVLVLAACAVSASFLSADPIPLGKGEKIVFLGDSITQGGGGAKGYVTLVTNALKEKHKDLGIATVNAGISGNKVPDLQRRLQRDVLDRKPTLVVVYIGINDVWHGENNPKNGTSPEAFEAGLKDVVGQILKTGSRVLVCTPTVIGELPGGANKLDAKLDQYSKISRGVAAELKVPLCDLRQAFADHLEKHNSEKKAAGILTTDRVHLNDAGNRLVAETILKHLGN